MEEASSGPSGPDLRVGVPLSDLADGAMLLGHVGEESVLVARVGEELFAIGSVCTHYGAPLDEGLIVGETVRCPWHHACFSLRNGEPLRPPALKRATCWKVEQDTDRLWVTEKLDAPRPPPPRARAPERTVIVGGGAAGSAAAEMLRRRGYEGVISLVSADPVPPYDRPNASKDYLAGKATEEWMPLWNLDFYREHRIDLQLGLRAATLDVRAREVRLASGAILPYDGLLLATGADPIQLTIPGANLPHVHTLRTLADSRRIIADAEKKRRAVVVGASFIGLEAAASLRERGLEVHVVAPEERPLARVMGTEIGDFVRRVHEEHGVRFHLQTKPATIDAEGVTLENGERIQADLVVVGIGVRPSLELAEQAGLATDRGVTVSEYLETSAPGVFAGGDIARWPDPHTGRAIRVEHWVVAQRHGQVAARNLLGERVRFDAVPFFWSAHYDLNLLYVGHAERWDRIETTGNLAARDARATFLQGGKRLAVVTIGRDREALEAELRMETDRDD